MKVKVDQLAGQLRKQPAPVYFIYGDEPLQVEESADAVRQAMRAGGEYTREIHHVDRSFDWSQLTAAADSLSLFAERKLVELRMPTGKPGRTGADALVSWCEQLPEDTTLMVICGKLDAATRRGRWCKALESVGVEVAVWPIDARQLPGWIRQRLQAVGLQPDAEAVQMIADRVEGNLLAARQEIDKLVLLNGEGAVDATAVASAVGDSARFDVFGLVDTALGGDTPRTLRILQRLRAEGVDPVLVLWALSREIQMLTQASFRARQGEPVNAILKSFRVMPRRQSLVQKGLSRLPLPAWRRLLHRCALTDQVIKGQRGGDSWRELGGISATLAGVNRL